MRLTERRIRRASTMAGQDRENQEGNCSEIPSLLAVVWRMTVLSKCAVDAIFSAHLERIDRCSVLNYAATSLWGSFIRSCMRPVLICSHSTLALAMSVLSSEPSPGYFISASFSSVESVFALYAP